MFEKIAFREHEYLFPRGLEEPHCKEETDTEGQGEAQGIICDLMGAEFSAPFCFAKRPVWLFAPKTLDKKP